MWVTCVLGYVCCKNVLLLCFVLNQTNIKKYMLIYIFYLVISDASIFGDLMLMSCYLYCILYSSCDSKESASSSILQHSCILPPNSLRGQATERVGAPHMTGTTYYRQWSVSVLAGPLFSYGESGGNKLCRTVGLTLKLPLSSALKVQWFPPLTFQSATYMITAVCDRAL